MTRFGGPISLGTPMRYSDMLPAEADAVVIGGGIAGVMSALYLARAGQRVVLCEKGRIAGEQSSRNWGWIRQQGRDPAELPLMMQSLRLWKGLSQELGDLIGLRQTGVTYLARDEQTLARYESWLDHARAYGLDTRLLRRAELDAILPNGAGWIGGLSTPSDARAEPFIAVPAIAGLAHDAGVIIAESCAVRALDLQGGALRGVFTERGLVRAERVLLAGGAWSALFARNAGLSIPQLSVRGTVAATEVLPGFWEGAAADADFAFRQRQDGGYTLAPGIAHDFWIGPDAFRHFGRFLLQLRRDFRQTRIRLGAPRDYPDAWFTRRRWSPDDVSPFERMRVLDPPPNPARLRRLQNDFARAFPGIGAPVVEQAWAGMIDVLPDLLPILDETPLRGLFVATGLSGHGFGIGPGIGRVMADLMLGRASGHDLRPFRYGRFTDGSPIRLGPSL